MLRMRFNTLGIHVYSGASQWAESFLSFEYGGVGHISYTDTSATRRWGYLPKKPPGTEWGRLSIMTRMYSAPARQQRRAIHGKPRKRRRKSGVNRSALPKSSASTRVWDLSRTVSPMKFSARFPLRHITGKKKARKPGPRIDPDSVAAKDILEARLAQLLEAYPSVKYVWLWEDESMSWESQKMNMPLSTTPFEQAHDFLRRHAPDKRLVVSGWGGVARHFEDFHRRLPGDIIFACLSDNLGWDPVHEVFGKLGDRERWPIPWLEDDPGMWPASVPCEPF